MKNEKQTNENIYFSRERVDSRFQILERGICLYFKFYHFYNFM